MPSRRHRSLTVDSRRNPSRTMRIFSSGCTCAEWYSSPRVRRTPSLGYASVRPLLCECQVGTPLLLSWGTLPPVRDLTPPQTSRVIPFPLGYPLLAYDL